MPGMGEKQFMHPNRERALQDLPHDFLARRDNMAIRIFCTLLTNASDNTVGDIAKRAVQYTDKLIAEIDKTPLC